MKSPHALATLTLAAALAFALAPSRAHAADLIPVTEDVMTSSFFTGANRVRGYAAESTRPVLRVSTPNPQGTTGAETIYLSFNQSFSSYTGPVVATLTVQSTEGGFGFDASAASPFLVSAHAVSANPLTAITDDTNSTGSINWMDFYNNNILPAASAARTSIAGLGAVSFDVSEIVNGWVNGSNTVQVIALTGQNDTSGNDFLHGFLNNNNANLAQGYNFLTVSAVPEPAAWMAWLLGLAVLVAATKRARP